MRAVSTLRLSERERDLFLAALANYGFENSADFLRAAARALIVHHRQKDQIEVPVSFQLYEGKKAQNNSDQSR